MIMTTQKKNGQVVLEYAAGMTILCVIIAGMIAIFRWGLMDMAERRYDHDAVLKNSALLTEEQLNPNFHQTRRLDP